MCASRLLLSVACLLAVGMIGCTPSAAKRPSMASSLASMREAATDSDDPELLGQWLLTELVSPGGDLKLVAEARQRVNARKSDGPFRHMALGVDADVHGRFRDATRHYLASIAAWREAAGPDVQLWGWFVTSRLSALKSAVPNLWTEAQPVVETAVRSPGNLGWRARGLLVEWWSEELFERRDRSSTDAILDRVRKKHGCLGGAEMVGPFGHGLTSDHRVAFGPEAPGPWPVRFEEQPGPLQPSRRAVEARGCLLRAEGPTPRGVYYLQSFVELEAEQEVIVAVQGAYKLFVDDHPVLDRDMGKWGVWPRFGVGLRLGPGRHRILARLMNGQSSIRVLGLDGTPLGFDGSADDRLPYLVARPTLGREPNVLEPWLQKAGVPARSGTTPIAPEQDLAMHRFAAAYLAHTEQQNDLASVIFEPLVKESSKATPVALAQQAVFVDGDPIYTATVAKDLARDLRQRAAKQDPELWGPQLSLALAQTDTQRPTEVVASLSELAATFPQVPAVWLQLGTLYGRLGWKAERLRTLEKAASRFGDDVGVLKPLMAAYEQAGEIRKADGLAKRIATIDPFSEVTLERALARRDYATAEAELRRLAKLQPDREDVLKRLAALLVRSGRGGKSVAQLKKALEDAPESAPARLALADARLAGGDRRALTNALAEAIRTGADDRALRNAIELVEGMTDLEPFRRDGEAVIASVIKSGEKLPGTAARILDYAAVWVASDGRARMLEHEIIRVQSREGIARHAEQRIPRGLVLRLRTIKADGTVFEPEIVSGKPTVTMPHLEVGDYIETEHIWALQGAADGGRAFVAPRWFFREENTSYHTSEFVLVMPEAIDAANPLIVEKTGVVPDAVVDRRPGMVVRSWRIDGSVALVEEAFRPPVAEFLPSVWVGWGIDPERRLVDLARSFPQRFPQDPRMVRIAASVVRGSTQKAGRPRSDIEAARRLYRWVLDTIEKGNEKNPPKIITGKSGQRTQAFLYLCRLAGIDASLAVVHDGLAPRPQGKLSRARFYSAPVVRVRAAKGESRWLLVDERYAPFGYLPTRLRGQPAVILRPAKLVTTKRFPPLEKATTPVEGDTNSVLHEGRIELRPDGSAVAELTRTYGGRYAIGLRRELAKTLKSRHRDIVEALLIGIPGARLLDMSMPNLDDLDSPFVLKMKTEVPTLARVAQGELLLAVPFLNSLTPLVQLPTRETPLYLSERAAVRVKVKLDIQLPKGATLAGELEALRIDEPRIQAEVKDRFKDGVVHIERSGSLPAGRVAPADYKAFRERVLRADRALNQKLRIRLR